MDMVSRLRRTPLYISGHPLGRLPRASHSRSFYLEPEGVFIRNPLDLEWQQDTNTLANDFFGFAAKVRNGR